MAIRLQRNREPVWVDIGEGASVFCVPPTTVLVYAAREQAAANIAQLKEVGEAASMLGGHLDDMPDISDEIGESATRTAWFVISLAELAVTDWKHILSAEGTPLTFDRSLLAELFSEVNRADLFYRNYLHPLNQVVAEGNA